MLDTVHDVIGKSFPLPDYYEVGREKIREYASAVHDDSPLHHDDEVARAWGFPGLIAPPTMLSSISFIKVQEFFRSVKLGIVLSQIMHTSQKQVMHRQVSVGDRVAAAITVERLRNVGEGITAVIRVDFTDYRTGESVMTITSTFLGGPDAVEGNASLS